MPALRSIRPAHSVRPVLLAIGLAAASIALDLALVGCAAAPPAPDAELPACPATCSGLCSAQGVCTCDGMSCQREVHTFGDAGGDAIAPAD